MSTEGELGRIFIVGFPRSGTTLMQTILGAHPQAFTLPETHGLTGLRMAGGRYRSRPRLALPPTATTEAHWRSLGLAMPHVRRAGPVRVSRYAHHLVRSMDALAQQAGADFWIEKTPGHLRFISHLQLVERSIQFVHVVRDALPAVASMVAVTRSHAEDWRGERSVQASADRWSSDLAITARYLCSPRHHLVRYEDLVDAPEATTTRLLVKLGLDAAGISAADLLQRRRDVVKRVVTGREDWKASVDRELSNHNRARISTELSASEVDYLTQRFGPPSQRVAPHAFDVSPRRGAGG